MTVTRETLASHSFKGTSQQRASNDENNFVVGPQQHILEAHFKRTMFRFIKLWLGVSMVINHSLAGVAIVYLLNLDIYNP